MNKGPSFSINLYTYNTKKMLDVECKKITHTCKPTKKGSLMVETGRCRKTRNVGIEIKFQRFSMVRRNWRVEIRGSSFGKRIILPMASHDFSYSNGCIETEERNNGAGGVCW